MICLGNISGPFLLCISNDTVNGAFKEQSVEYMQILTAFAGGILTFISPCILPLIPLYLGYLGATMDQPGRNTIRILPFILGFTWVFVLLGLAATSLGRFLLAQQVILKQVSGGALIILGLMMTSLISLPFFEREIKFSFLPTGKSWLGAFLFGTAFALGWTPCTGPILASILIFAGSAGTMGWGAILLVAFSLGIGLPLLMAAYFADRLLPSLISRGRLLRRLQITGGLLIAFLGVLTLLGKL